jgi:hypothetical protein
MTVNKAQSLLEQVEISDEMTRQRVVIATELSIAGTSITRSPAATSC